MISDYKRNDSTDSKPVIDGIEKTSTTDETKDDYKSNIGANVQGPRLIEDVFNHELWEEAPE